MAISRILAAFLFFILSGIFAGPLRHEDGLALGQIPQAPGLGEHAARSRVVPELVRSISEDERGQARFPLPGPIPIDTEQIKKVAQILLVLGEQVIPAILGDSMNTMKGSDTPNDDVAD